MKLATPSPRGLVSGYCMILEKHIRQPIALKSQLDRALFTLELICIY
jgi:hypothetical protein